MRITSTANPKIRHARKLSQQRKTREAAGAFLVEGVQAVTRACECGWPVRALIYCPDHLRSERARRTVERVDPDVRIEVTESVLASLSARDAPAELLAVVGEREDMLARIPIEPDLLVIALEAPSVPGNLGTIIRSADALGAHGVIVLGDAVDLYDPKTVRATMGSLFSVPVVRVGAIERFADWLESARKHLPALQAVAAMPAGATDVFCADFVRPSVLVIGSERKGISDELLDLCAAQVSIPMSGRADSLNTAIAASILLYEARRQRLVRATT